ncbi:MAG: hypothetical protein RML49_02825 [Verrucomicrobiae bacterium]|nr:hypothetical protein [Verrucomicrobiae bacterium]
MNPSLRTSSLLITAALLLHLTPTTTHTTEQQRFTLQTYDDFAPGENPTTTLTADGTLLPAPLPTPLAEPTAENIWAILPEADKHWIGTGTDGRLYLLNGKNLEATEKFQENFIHSIVRRQSGKINLATSPDGKIYELRGKDKPAVIFDPKAKYIWSMVCDAQDNLYIATGTDGIIYKLNPQNQSEIYYDSDETHIRTLALDPQGRLLAGSANSGYLYLIPAKDTAVVLAATGLQEVNSIAVAPPDLIYFSANATPQQPSTNQSPNQNQTPQNSFPTTPRPQFFQTRPTNPSPTTPRPDRQSSQQKASHLYALHLPTLYPHKIWESDDTIFTLTHHQDTLYIGTGPAGYLYTYTPTTRSINRLLKLPSESITHILPLNPQSWLIATNNPPRLYTLDPNTPHTPHTYTSPILDAQIHSQWGHLKIHGSPTITARTRSGNTPTPDKSWHPWTPTQNGRITSPPARYIQFELTRPPHTSLHRIDLYYLNKNIPPQISQFHILPPNVAFNLIPNSPTSPQSVTPDQLLNYLTTPPSSSSTPKPETNRFQPEERRGLRTALWKASDPNGDKLRFTLHFQKADDPTPHLLAEKINETLFSWDTAGWPDGRYRLILTATDEPSNYKTNALTTTATSEIFYVDNTPPTIRVNRISPESIEFTIEEEASEITSVTTSTDGHEFLPAPPNDHIIDTPRETFTVTRDKGKPLFIRAEDACGNISSRFIEP